MRSLSRLFPGFAIMIGSTVLGQEPPLQPTGLFDRSEIILVWDEGNTFGAKIRERNIKLKFNYQGFEEGDRIRGAERTADTLERSYYDRQFDVISGDFNGDNMADYLYSYTADDDSLHLVLANRTTSLHYTERTMYRSDGRFLPGKNLILGDLDGDGTGEFIAGFRNFSDDTARIAIFGFDSEFRIELRSVIADLTGGENIMVELCDLDGNGDDELVVGYEEYADPSAYTLRVYDFDDQFRPRNTAELQPSLAHDASAFSYVALTAVDYDGDGKEELVLAFNKNEIDNKGVPDTYLYTAEVMDDPSTGEADPLERIAFYSDKMQSGRHNSGYAWQILMKSGDLNGDGSPEILLGCYDGLEIYQPVSDNQLEYLDKENEVKSFDENLTAVQFFDVADITGDDRDDVVAVNHNYIPGSSGYQNFNILIYTFDDELNSEVIEEAYQFERLEYTPGYNERKFAMSLSDFDGDLFRIGEYTSLGCFTDVIRPITVLNTPPVHFDYIDGVVHDVNECFGQNDCQSSVQKSTVEYSEESYSFQRSSTGDWGFDPLFTAGVDLNVKGNGVSMSPVEISHYFGGDLEEVVVDRSTTSIGKSTSTSRFQTESMDRRFSRDDALLTMVNDYERWEYPVYNEYDELLGEIVILIPETTSEENWLRGREVLEVSGLVRLHEPGNLLSYRKFYSDPEELKKVNPDIREIISIANEHELDLNSSYTESITWGKEFENSNVSVENVVETMPSGGVSLLGIQIGVEDESVAEEEVIRSHTIRAGQNLGIEVTGSQLAGNSYEYKVKPYYYWSKNGSMVVDYMVDLSAGSFWEENYSVQDPGFLLPNRLDSLKVKNEIDRITDLEEYLKTPSIMLDPAIPVNGDTVTVTTVIHNLSLNPTDQPVEVSFYLGDPDRGGSLISDVEGNTVFPTGEAIGDQNYAMLRFQWVAGFERNDRMYALIDPAGKMTENREDNNKAWAPVQRFAACGEVTGTGPLPTIESPMEERFTPYPNPASSNLYLDYRGPFFRNASLKVIDLSGRVRKQQELRYLGKSGHYTINTGSLEPGIYLLDITTGHYRQRSRLIIK